MFERVLYVNTYCLTLLFYTAPVFALPENLAKQIERAIWRFVWTGKLEKLQIKMLYFPVESGGTGVADFRVICKTLFLRNICELVVKEEPSTAIMRQWFLPIVNEDAEEKVKKLSKKIPTPLRWIVSPLKKAKELGALRCDLGKEELKKVSRDVFRSEKEPNYRAREKEPFIDFQLSFKNLSELPFSYEQKEFVYCMIHGILPFSDRVSRILKTQTPTCLMCGDEVLDGLLHELIQCPSNGGLPQRLLEILENEGIKTTSVEEKKKALKLSFCVKGKQRNYALCLLVTSVSMHVWKMRKRQKQVKIPLANVWLESYG